MKKILGKIIKELILTGISFFAMSGVAGGLTI